MTDKSRREFENKLNKLVRGIASFEIDDVGEYGDKSTYWAWWGWQASRAAIEIDIPSSCDSEYWIDDVFQRVRFERDVEKSAIAAGLKVKGVSA